MKCSMCNQLCELPTNNTSSIFAIILEKDKIICNQCQDVLDWTNICDISKNKPIESVSKKNTSNIVMIRCPKCKSQFSGHNCSCGFKNPLYR